MPVRDRFNAFIRRHEIPWELGMGFLAIIYVAVGFALDDPGPDGLAVLAPLETVLTVVFLAEFVSRFSASRDHLGYLRGHWIDLVALIPVARGLRIARLLRVLRLSRFFAGTYRSVIGCAAPTGSPSLSWDGQP